MPRASVAPLLLLTLLLAAAQARADGTAIGVGAVPVVAVDPGSVGHAAWRLADGQVRSCRITAGTTVCAAVRDLPNGAGIEDASTLNVFAPSAGDVSIFGGGAYCSTPGGAYHSVWRFASTDSGGSFGGPACKTLTGGNAYATVGANWLDAQGRFYAASEGRFLALEPGNGTSATPAISLVGASSVVGASVAVGGGQLVVADEVGFTQTSIRYAVFRGGDPNAASTAALNDPVSWDTDLVAPSSGQSTTAPIAIGGPSGAFVVYGVWNGARDALYVAKLDPATHRLAQPVLAGQPPHSSAIGAVQDASGRIHLTWTDTGKLQHAWSSDGGRTFASPRTIGSGGGYQRHRIAAGPDGRGWVIWESGGTVRLLAFEARAPPDDPAGPSGGGGGGPSGSAWSATWAVVEAGGGRLRVALETPRACVRPGTRFSVRVRARASSRLRVRRVAFRLGRRAAAVDARAPFSRTFKAPAAGDGAVRITARVVVVGKAGAGGRTSIVRAVRVCARAS